MCTAKEYYTLNSGHNVPSFGLGTWLSKPGEVERAVEQALKNGYKHIDCARMYHNETEIGDALARCFKEGVVKREEVFITSKLWSNDQAPQDVETACRSSLKDLKLDYLDLYLIHQSAALSLDASRDDVNTITEEQKLGYSAEKMAKTWEAMEKLVEKGLVKSIGISNFTIVKMDKLLKTAKIVPALNQVECHPYFQQPKLKKYCDLKGIVVGAYSPLANPSLGSADDPNPLKDPVVKEIAKKHSVSAAQVCIAFLLHRGMVVTPKSVNLERLKENLASTRVRLDDEDMKKLQSLDRNRRMLKYQFLYKKGQSDDEFWTTKEDEEFKLPE
eukprot:Em0023g106a